MASKQQELEALEKIQEIVRSLGEESYIGFAMEGVVEDAKQNIENDFACSYKSRYESTLEKFRNANVEHEDIQNDLNGQITELKMAVMAKANEIKELKDLADKKSKEAAEENSRYLDSTCKIVEKDQEIQNLRSEAKDQKLVIMELKAKLYDMMMKEAERC